MKKKYIHGDSGADMFYFNCPICKKLTLTDEGSIVLLNDGKHERFYHICLDCGDRYSKKELLDLVSHNETKKERS